MRRALFLALGFMPIALQAQMIDVQPGARVRVTAPGVIAGRLQGTVIARMNDSIVVATPQMVQYRLALGSLSEIAVSQGKSRAAGAKRGAIWGAGITAPLLMIGVAGDSTFRSSGEKAGFIAVGTAMYAGIGALIGAAIGAEGWSSHVTTKPQIAVTASHAGLRIGARAAF
jgi:hypothetical protein